MYYSNLNLLMDLRKITLLIPKLHSIIKYNNINNIERYIKYHNKLAKNINEKFKYYEKNLYKIIDIEDVYNFKYIIHTKKVPKYINIKNCYYLNTIYKNNILKSYKYKNGLDAVICHKINKVTDTILFLIYKNNGMIRNKDKLIRLEDNCINIWNTLYNIDYSLYYKLNMFLKKILK